MPPLTAQRAPPNPAHRAARSSGKQRQQPPDGMRRRRFWATRSGAGGAATLLDQHNTLATNSVRTGHEHTPSTSICCEDIIHGKHIKQTFVSNRKVNNFPTPSTTTCKSWKI